MRPGLFLSGVLFIVILYGASIPLAKGISQDEILIKNLLEKSGNLKKLIYELQEFSVRTGIQVPPQVSETAKNIESEISVLNTGEKSEKLSVEKTRGILERYEKIMQQIYKMRSAITNIANARNQYPLCLDSEFYKEYEKIFETEISAYAVQLLLINSGTSASIKELSQSPETARKCRFLASALKVLEAEREVDLVPDSNSRLRFDALRNLPQNSPFRKEFKAFCENYIKNVSGELAELNAGKKFKNGENRYETAFSYWTEILSMEGEFYRNESQFKGLKGTEEYTKYLGKVQGLQDMLKKIIALSLSQENADKAAGEVASMKKELGRMRNDLKSEASKLQNFKFAMERRTKMDSIIKNCPEMAQTEYPSRFNELLKKLDDNAAALSKALSENRRVPKAEAECRKQMLNLEFEFLIKEADMEAYFIRLAAKKEKLDSEEQKKLDILILQYKGAFKKLKDAKLEAMDVGNRLKMLELKSELFEEEVEKLENEFEETRSNSEGFFDRVLNGGTNRRASKDIEDARKISNENPVGDIKSR